jgi:carbonic anhydrase
MSLITRRRFGALLGMVAASGSLRQLHAQGKGEVKVSAPAASAPPKAPGSVSPVNRETASPETIWADLMAGNKRYVTGKTAVRDVIRGRADTVKAQHPSELIFDQNIGDLFVVRTAGNVADPIAIASLEYAADHLDSRMLVVLGHENCSVISATLSGEAQPSENLTALIKKIRPGVERLKDLVSGDALMTLAVEANVHHSAADVLENSAMLRHGVASGDLTVVKALYKLSTGEVSALNKIYESI